MAPIHVPKKCPICREELQGSTIVVLWGQPYTLVCLDNDKYCPNGGMASPTSTAAVGSGPTRRSWPFRRSPENRGLQGRSSQGSGIRALWGQRSTRLAFSADARSTAPTGAWLSPTRVGGRGGPNGDDGPFAPLLKTAVLQGKSSDDGGGADGEQPVAQWVPHFDWILPDGGPSESARVRLAAFRASRACCLRRRRLRAAVLEDHLE